MSKKRKTRNVGGDSAGGDSVGDRVARDRKHNLPRTDQPLPRPSALLRFGLPLFVVFLALYLTLFFTSPEPSLHGSADGAGPLLRFDMAHWLWRIRLPELPRLWTGGEWRNVGIGDRAIVLIAASLVLSSATIFGWLLLDLTQAARGLTKIETYVFSLGVGLNALSLLVFGIGLAGFLPTRSAFAVPMVLILCVAIWRMRERARLLPSQEAGTSRVARQEPRPPSAPRPPSDWLRASALWLGAPFVLILLAGALFPPREFDVREYHLQAPKEWFQAGRITFLPHNIYANMPLGPQILSLASMGFVPGEQAWWWGAMAGKLLLASYAPLAALALFAAGRRFFSESAGVIAALVYISIPWIAHVAMEGYVDAALACYLFLAVYAAFLAGAAETSGDRWRRWLLAGFLAGAAVSSKYPGALFVVAPLTVWVVVSGLIAPRQPVPSSDAPPIPIWRRFDVKSIAAFLLAVAIAIGPWLAKNWVLTGNPTYPLLYSMFGGETRTPENDDQWRIAHAVPRNDYGERYSPRQIGDAIANVAVRSEWLSPILWPLAALALFSHRHRRTVLIVASMLLFVLVAWFAFTHRIDRFWLPALPLAALLAGAGATLRSDAWWRRVVFALLFWGLVWNFMVIAGALTSPKLLVAYDTLRQDASLAPLAHVHLNKIVLPGSSVLLVGDAQPFDLDMPAYYNTCFDACVFEEWLRGKSRAARLDELHRRNVSHVLVNWSEIERYRSPGNYGYSEWPQPAVFAELVRQGVLKNPQRVRSRISGQWGELYKVGDASL